MFKRNRSRMVPGNAQHITVTVADTRDDRLAESMVRASWAQTNGLTGVGRTGRVAVFPGSTTFGRMSGYLTAGGLTPISLVGQGGRRANGSITEQRALPMESGDIISQNQALYALRRNGGGK